MSPSNPETDVLVVGAGPVGLTLACELRRHGVPCRVLDDGDGPTPPEQSRALALHARTLEVFDGMGLAGPILQRGRRIRALDASRGGHRFARFEFDFSGLDTPYPFVISLSQGETEKLLVDRLRGLGGAVEWRTRLEGLSQDADGVSATLAGDADGRRPTRTGWLVGCDGAHSTVRQQLGLPFTGASSGEKFLLADVRMSCSLAPDEGHLLFTADGPVAAFPMPRADHWRLIDATGTADVSEPAAILEQFRRLLRQDGLKGAVIAEAEWASSFHISRRTTGRLRVGRCFLAGDAAHVHSPVGGQGMNTGIQDAHDLAWKLALVRAGAAPPSLLDSYEAERQPVAEAVLRETDRATWIATLKNPVGRGLRDLLAGWLSHWGFARRRITLALSELGINYRGSPVVAEDWTGHLGGAPRAGDRVPDVELAPERTERARSSPEKEKARSNSAGGPARLFDLLRETRHVLLLFEGSGATSADLDGMAEVVRGQRAEQVVPYRVCRPGAVPGGGSVAAVRPLHDPDGRLHRRFDARTACAYLIRPDGYVGYRGRPASPERLAAYLGRVLR
jgi:2-polyprenyl-6-methoxyphenol hydroxylase-like FAD-dependent oxidoreductase